MKKFFGEFKKFITRGNVLDLAVGVIIGGAFTAIVNALTNGVLLPLIGACTGGVDVQGLRVPLWNATKIVDDAGAPILDQWGQVTYSSAIYYGQLINAIIQFLLIALVLFIIIKSINGFHARIEKLKKKEEAQAAAAEPAPTPEPVLTKSEELLIEIRDLLKKSEK